MDEHPSSCTTASSNFTAGEMPRVVAKEHGQENLEMYRFSFGNLTSRLTYSDKEAIVSAFSTNDMDYISVELATKMITQTVKMLNFKYKFFPQQRHIMDALKVIHVMINNVLSTPTDDQSTISSIMISTNTAPSLMSTAPIAGGTTTVPPRHFKKYGTRFPIDYQNLRPLLGRAIDASNTRPMTLPPVMLSPPSLLGPQLLGVSRAPLMRQPPYTLQTGQQQIYNRFCLPW